MKKDTFTQIITGLGITLVGVGALLDALHIIPFWGWFSTWWPLILVVSAAVVLINDTRSFIWSIALALAGGLILLRNLDITDINVFSLIWPIVILAIGISILINRTVSPSKKARVQDIDNLSAVFGGSETLNKSQDYQGGKVSAIFGGITLDLREAAIKKEATLNIFALCGGVEIKVPKGWQVKSHVFPILGGVENKANDSENKEGPVLIIAGNVALGGVEVKY